jgi:hypothetical protein
MDLRHDEAEAAQRRRDRLDQVGEEDRGVAEGTQDVERACADRGNGVHPTVSLATMSKSWVSGLAG